MAKDTVEDYKAITIQALVKAGALRGGSKRGPSYSSSSLQWSRGGSVQFSIDDTITAGTMYLKYSYKGYSSNDQEYLNYPVQLVTTPCHYGGVRWWFRCPISRNGIPCGRRVGVLYLGKYAGCRHCHDLIYQSSKDSHKFDSMAFGMGYDPRAFGRMMNRIGKD